LAKKILQNKGLTLVEMILACAIISIFFLGTGAVLSSAAKVYIQETTSSGARGAIETAGDDIKNYIMSGKDVRLLFYMDGVRTEITLADGISTIDVTKPEVGGMTSVPLDKGSILYTDGTYRDKDGKMGQTSISLTEAQQKELEKVAEGIDLGYKIIYITEDGKYIQGLPYAKAFYRDMTMSLEISKTDLPENAFYVYGSSNDTERYKGQNLYTVKLVGKGKDDIFTVTLNTAVMGMNDLDFK
jgi:prepilin-type N-terminal cleavage/methylation domain-containing protein